MLQQCGVKGSRKHQSVLQILILSKDILLAGMQKHSAYPDRCNNIWVRFYCSTLRNMKSCMYKMSISVFYSLSVKPVPFWMNTELISWQELKKDTHEGLPQWLSVSLCF